MHLFFQIDWVNTFYHQPHGLFWTSFHRATIYYSLQIVEELKTELCNGSIRTVDVNRLCKPFIAFSMKAGSTKTFSFSIIALTNISIWPFIRLLTSVSVANLSNFAMKMKLSASWWSMLYFYCSTLSVGISYCLDFISNSYLSCLSKL